MQEQINSYSRPNRDVGWTVVAERIPVKKQTSGLNTKKCAMCHLLLPLRCTQKTQDTMVMHIPLCCCSLNNRACWNMHYLLSWLGLELLVSGPHDSPIPWKLHLPLPGRLTNKEIYWPIYMIYQTPLPTGLGVQWCKEQLSYVGSLYLSWSTCALIFKLSQSFLFRH
jgi:hypothetical protein